MCIKILINNNIKILLCVFFSPCIKISNCFIVSLKRYWSDKDSSLSRFESNRGAASIHDCSFKMKPFSYWSHIKCINYTQHFHIIYYAWRDVNGYNTVFCVYYLGGVDLLLWLIANATCVCKWWQAPCRARWHQGPSSVTNSQRSFIHTFCLQVYWRTFRLSNIAHTFWQARNQKFNLTGVKPNTKLWFSRNQLTRFQLKWLLISVFFPFFYNLVNKYLT